MANSGVASTLDLVHKAIEAVKRDIGPVYVKDLKGRLKADALHRINSVMDYVLADGKCSRSCLVVDTFRALRPQESKEGVFQVCKVAVVMEIMQAFFLIIDDVMDNGETRRGKPCWHRLPNVGLVAINDGLMLDQMIDLIIRQTIPEHPKLNEILINVQETKRRTVLGELFDTTSKTLEECTFDKYEQIIENKTTYYTYILPIRLGYLLAERDDYTELEEFAKRLGLLFSALDDYQDCFANSRLTGKTSLGDLADGKCTWISCTFYNMISNGDNADVLNRFRRLFSSRNANDLNEALEILKTFNVDKLYAKYEREESEALKAMECYLSLRTAHVRAYDITINMKQALSRKRELISASLVDCLC